jgi:hypothetical protein
MSRCSDGARELLTRSWPNFAISVEILAYLDASISPGVVCGQDKLPRGLPDPWWLRLITNKEVTHDELLIPHEFTVLNQRTPCTNEES